MKSTTTRFSHCYYTVVLRLRLRLMSILLVLLFSGVLAAQCPVGNLTLLTQAEVDDFPTNYPGCTMLSGGLRLGGSGSDITNVDGLSSLTDIGGNLEFVDLPIVDDFDGLANLETIGGNFAPQAAAIILNLRRLLFHHQ